MARVPHDLDRHISSLRRYARALAGSQALGDQYVDVTIEAVAADPARLAMHAKPRLELFRLFHELWGRTAPAEGRDVGGPSAWECLGGAAAVERQLLLLVSVEGWSRVEAAYILGIAEDRAQALFDAAQATTARRRSDTPILIIEDELLIAMHLETILDSAGYRVCGIAGDEAEALQLAVEARPRLILADIRLRRGESGIAAVCKILSALTVPVIFITGYPQDLLTGAAPEPAFVIAKPFAAESVIAAVSQALLAERPAAPDATWRLRGRPPENFDAGRLRTATSGLSDAGPLRHNVDNPRASEEASCRLGARAATHGSRDARRADTAGP